MVSWYHICEMQQINIEEINLRLMISKNSTSALNVLKPSLKCAFFKTKYAIDNINSK